MTARFHAYQRASWEGEWAPQVGTRNLQLSLLERFDRSLDFGIFNDRTVRGGTSPSLHREGRAGDLGFPYLHPQGFEARDLLLANSWELGLQALIWDRRWYSAAHPLGRYYDGVNPHRDHIHYEQNWLYARLVPLSLDMARQLLGEQEMTLKRNDQGLAVFDMRAGLSEFFRNPDIMLTSINPQLFDGPMVDLVKAFQGAYGLPATGEIDGITAVQIRSWVRPRTFPG